MPKNTQDLLSVFSHGVIVCKYCESFYPRPKKAPRGHCSSSKMSCQGNTKVLSSIVYSKYYLTLNNNPHWIGILDFCTMTFVPGCLNFIKRFRQANHEWF